MNAIIRAVLACTAAALAWMLPDLAFAFASYKQKKRGLEVPRQCPSVRWRMVSTAVCLAYEGAAMWYMPQTLAVLSILFVYAAIFGSCVDMMIRIIANEMLLALLPVGIGYRILAGGIGSLKGSLGGLMLVLAVFASAAAVTRLIKGIGGVGMGDIKLAMVAAVTAGWPGSLYFLGGMALAIGAFCLIGVKSFLLRRDSTFPMCGHIMAGLLIALIYPYIQGVMT